MPSAQPCALQRAYLQLRKSGREQEIDELAALVADITVSTRAAARQAQTGYGVNISHNVFTSHRNGTCNTCARIVADAQDEAETLTAKAEKKATAKGKANTKVFTASADGMVIPTSADAPPPPPSGANKARLFHEEDGSVVIKDVPLYTPLQIDDDLSPLLLQFGMNPENYEVLKDTFSMWMQSASDGAGGRDVVYLYSAKFRRVGKVDPEVTNTEALKQWRSVLLKTKKATKPTFKKSDGTVGTYALWPSDLQLGKTRTAEAVQNFRTGVTQHLEECQRLIDTSVPIEGLHIGWGGDETEGVANNYKNQAHTIELNLAEQLELDFDLRVWAIKEALQLGIPVSASSCISNHGEWTRNGGKDVETTKSDNASTHVARQVRKMFDELEPFTGNKINWTIPSAHGANPGLVLNLSGEKVYSSHGHIEKGRGGSTELKTKNAIEKQLLGDIMAERRLIDIRLFVMAHYHHHYSIEDRGRLIMGLPALEAERSSEYMMDQFGVWSPPGLAGMVIGRFDLRPYRHLNVFGQNVEKTQTLRAA